MLFKKLFNKESANSSNIDIKYPYWRLRVFYAMYIGYVVYYFARSSLKSMQVFVVGDILTTQEYGMIIAATSIAYAVSKFLAGILTDLANPRYIMFTGLIASGFLNIFVTRFDSFIPLLTIWTMNGFLQGFGWPPVAKMLTQWYTKKERGRWWGVWSTSHNVGEFLMPIIGSLACILGGWKYGMYIAGGSAIIVSFFLLERLRSSPNEVGLPNVSDYMNDTTDKSSFAKKEALPFTQILMKYVFKNGYVWSLVCASIFVYFVRGALSIFISIFFKQQGYSSVAALSMLSFFELGGLFGSFASGWISDTLFNGKRSITNIIFCLGIAICAFTILYTPITSSLFYYLAVMLLGFFVYGPQMLLGISVAEVSNKDAISTSTGFVGLWGYVGTTAAGLLIPHLDGNWNDYFTAIMFSGLIAIIFFIPLIKFDYFSEAQ